MSLPVSPYFRSPLSDIFGVVDNHQMMNACAKLEMKAVNCLEAYGEEMAEIKCADIIHDFRQCSTRTLEMRRVLEMRLERERQVANGTRGFAEGPTLDSYEAPNVL